MKGICKGLGIFALALTFWVSASCSQAPAPVSIPSSVPAVQVYNFYQQERDANPVRLDYRIDNAEVRTFTGAITKIEGSKIQFLSEERFLARDKYLECKFSSEEGVLRLSKSDTVTVYGNLEDVNAAVKFKNCVLLP